MNRALQKFRSGGYSDLATLDFNADELKELLASARLEDRFDVYRLKAWYHYLRKEFDLSREAQIEAFKLQPTIETIKNIGILFRTLGQAGNGIRRLAGVNCLAVSRPSLRLNPLLSHGQEIMP